MSLKSLSLLFELDRILTSVHTPYFLDVFISQEMNIIDMVIFCHGFPGLWFSWHRQIPALTAAGYRVIAPDMRGMGLTDSPNDYNEYSVDHITSDLLGLMGVCEIKNAIFIGIDFGAFAIQDFALRHPDYAYVLGPRIEFLVQPDH